MATPLDNQPVENTEEKAVEEKSPTKPDDLFLSNDLSVELRSLARSLGVENHGDLEHFKGRLEAIVKWAAEKGAKDREDVVWMAQELASRIGGPTIGQNMIEHLSVYARLELDKLNIEKKMKKYHVSK